MRYPMRLDDRGLAISTTNASEIWADRVRLLLATYRGERAGMPEYGTTAQDSVFNPLSNALETVQLAIQEAITRFVPELESVSVTTYEVSDGYIGVDVLFAPPNAKTTSISTSVDITLLGLG